jgi:hypothetical protein
MKKNLTHLIKKFSFNFFPSFSTNLIKLNNKFNYENTLKSLEKNLILPVQNVSNKIDYSNSNLNISLMEDLMNKLNIDVFNFRYLLKKF